jgi:hypothetical protein
MTKNTKPRWPIEKAIYYGKEALKLAQEHKTNIEPRLDAGALDGLQSNLSQLDAFETGRPAKTTEVKGLTGSQADITEKGHAWVAAVRLAVKGRADGAGLEKAVGVGLPARGKQAKSIETAIQAILTAAQERPAELRACGILDADIQRGRAILTGIQGARSTQDDGMGQKKDLTDLKNRAQRAVEKTTIAISDMGNLEYMESNPALAQRFLDVAPGNGGGGNEAPPTGDQSTPKPPETKA